MRGRADVWAIKDYYGRCCWNFFFCVEYVPCPVHFLHVPAIGSFSHWVFNAPNEQFGFGLLKFEMNLSEHTWKESIYAIFITDMVFSIFIDLDGSSTCQK